MGKEKRGFTLVELIAVITILALILVIAIPSIFKAKGNADKGLDKEERRNIVEAGKHLGVDLDDYMSDVFNCKSDSWVRDRCVKENNKWKVVTVSVEELVSHGYLTDKTDKWTGLITIENDKTNGNYIVAFEEDESTAESLNKEIIVTFDANGGVLTDNTRNYIEGENYGNTPTPIKEGFVFMGWFTEKTGGDEIKRTMPVKNENHTLYAHFKETKLTIVFNANGGITPLKNKNVINGNPYGDLPTPLRSGYSFDGWYTEKTGGDYIQPDTIVNISSTQNLYAHWSARCNMSFLVNKFGILSATGSPNFGNLADTSEIIYTLPDDYGSSYYYRGTVTNNYMKFAGFYWRIIRVNGDGSLRMIYDGQQAYPNGTSSLSRSAIANVKWNSTDVDNKYAGYMYGENSTTLAETQSNIHSSNVKSLLDNWYKQKIYDTGYSIYVEDKIFCGDRKVYSGGGYGNSVTDYAAKYRLVMNKSPQFTCSQKNDAFTVNDTSKGNGALTYPVGLITADEISAAGGVFGIYDANPNTAFYLYKGHYYWAMSAAVLDSGHYLYNFSVANKGNLDYRRINNIASIAPVINLSMDYACGLIGTGKINDPFRASGISP